MKSKLYKLFLLLIFVPTIGYSQSEEFRVNEQVGNSKKSNIKAAINENNISTIVWNDEREGKNNIYAQQLNSFGEIIGDNIKINFPNDNKYYYSPDVSVVSKNNFLIIWQDTRKGTAIYGQLLDEQGNLIGENYFISDENNNSSKLAPSIASSGRGVIVTWSDRRNGNFYDVYAQRLNKDGEKIGENFIVNSDTQSVSLYTPVSSFDMNGNICTTWRANVDGSYKLFYILRDSNNIVVSEQATLTDETITSSSIGNPSIAKSKSGYFATWFRYYENDYNIMGQFIDSVGQKIDSNFIVNDDVNSTQLYPFVSSDSSGNLVVSWYDYRNFNVQIYSQRFENDTLVGNNFNVSEDELIGSKSNVTNSMNNSGNFVIAWLDFEEPTKYIIYSRIIGRDNVPISSSVRVDDDENSSNETTPNIKVFNDGSYIIVWTDSRDRTTRTYFQLYNKDGNPNGTNIEVSDNGSQTQPNVVINHDGTFLIIWREYTRSSFNQYEVVAQKYFQTGEKSGDKFVASSKAISGSTNFLDGASNMNGESVITWERRVGGTTRIYAQKYDSGGLAVGENFLVSTDTTTNNYAPKVGLDSAGNFAIVYHGYDKNNYEIYLSRFDMMSNRIDSTITINDDNIKNSQYYADISVNEKGEAVVVWFDYRTTRGVYFQKLINIGSRDSFNRVDSNKTVADYSIGINAPSASINESGEFAISWSEKAVDFSDVKFRIFNPDLSPKTEVMITSNFQKRDQINSKIFLSNDKVYNVWQDNHEPGVGYDIWANVFDLNEIFTDIEDDEALPSKFELSQNYPNPFNPSTAIEYTIPNIASGHNAYTKLILYDILGREVKTLVNKKQNPGSYKFNLNASYLTSGVYFYKLSVGDFVETKKMLLLK